jgi:hypothetical protein
MKTLFMFLMSVLCSMVNVFANEKGSVEITEAMVDMFSANVMHLSQQSESRLRPYCRQESFNAEAKFFDRIGKRKARKKEGRHSQVVYDNTPHSRRQVVMEDFYDADLVDDEDKLRVIMNPESEYAMAIASSLGRQMDEEIIAGALGNAYAGKKGQTPVSLPDSQKVAAFDGLAALGLGLNVQTLRAIRKKFKQNEAIQKGEQLIITVAAQQIDDLLGNTEVTSADFNTVRALVDGELDTYMGMKFVETELLPFNDTVIAYDVNTGAVGAGGGAIAIGEARRCFVMTSNRGVLCATAREVNGRVSEIAEKHYSHQVYGSLSVGVTRMEEEQVVEFFCKEV